MKKIDPTVLKETRYIACLCGILSAFLQAAFLVSGFWDYTVLLGNLLSVSLSVLNFFLMGLTVQNALGKEEKEARNAMKVSQMYRTMLLLVITVLGVVLPCFNLWTVLIPLLFPRIAVAIRPLFDRNK